MLSHPLEEVRRIGEEVKKAALAEIPTLVKYAAPLPYLTQASVVFSKRSQDDDKEIKRKQPEGKSNWCQLIDHDPEGEIKILTATLFHFGEMPYTRALEIVRSASEVERAEMATALLGHLGEHDIPLRELEHTTYTFDLILDQGGFAEFKRHRMMTQTPQALTTRLGYTLPRQIVKAGFEHQYRSTMDAAAEMYEKLVNVNPYIASYVVPNGFNRRVLFTMNLREAFAFCQLRSASNAHFSMRRVAQRVAEEIRRVHPLLANYFRLPEETWQEIESQNF
jgi:thymidylate synthase ThyX